MVTGVEIMGACVENMVPLVENMVVSKNLTINSTTFTIISTKVVLKTWLASRAPARWYSSLVFIYIFT